MVVSFIDDATVMGVLAIYSQLRLGNGVKGVRVCRWRSCDQ